MTHVQSSSLILLSIMTTNWREQKVGQLWRCYANLLQKSCLKFYHVAVIIANISKLASNDWKIEWQYAKFARQLERPVSIKQNYTATKNYPDTVIEVLHWHQAWPPTWWSGELVGKWSSSIDGLPWLPYSSIDKYTDCLSTWLSKSLFGTSKGFHFTTPVLWLKRSLIVHT